MDSLDAVDLVYLLCKTFGLPRTCTRSKTCSTVQKVVDPPGRRNVEGGQVAMAEKTLDALLSSSPSASRRAEEGGGRARQDRQARLGRLNARERVALLLDPGSFQELGRHVKSRHAA